MARSWVGEHSLLDGRTFSRLLLYVRWLQVNTRACRRFLTIAQTKHVQAKMTAVTALFMIPPALVFPALMRKANTPPPSVTLTRPRWDQLQAGDEQPTVLRDGCSIRQRDRPSEEQGEEPPETKPGGGERKQHAGTIGYLATYTPCCSSVDRLSETFEFKYNPSWFVYTTSTTNRLHH